MMVTLTYVLTTFNKLPYLKLTIPDLLNAISEDEELIVVDGGSTDGTKEYLEELYKQGKINIFISEKDFGEPHGMSKGFLLSNGELIKCITDDDVFDYKIIKECKDYMLLNKQVHAMGADGIGTHLIVNKGEYNVRNSEVDFDLYKKNRTPFIWSGLSLLIRKDILAYSGLVNSHFIIPDFEYALRLTSLKKLNFSYHTGLMYVNIVNTSSNQGLHWKKMELEKEMVQYLYNRKRKLISFSTIDKFKSVFRPFKKFLFTEENSIPLPYEEIYNASKKRLEDLNRARNGKILD